MSKEVDLKTGNLNFKYIVQKEADTMFKKIEVESLKKPSKNLNKLIKKGNFIQRTKLKNVNIEEPLKISISLDQCKITRIEYAFTGRIDIEAKFYSKKLRNFITGKKKLEFVKELFKAKNIGDKIIPEDKMKNVNDEFEERSKTWVNVHQETVTKKVVRFISRPNTKNSGNVIVLKIRKFKEKSNPKYFEIKEGGIHPQPEVDLNMPVLCYFKVFSDVTGVGIRSRRKTQKDKKSSFYSFKKIKEENRKEDIVAVEGGEFSFSDRKVGGEVKPPKRFDELFTRKRVKKLVVNEDLKEGKKMKRSRDEM